MGDKNLIALICECHFQFIVYDACNCFGAWLVGRAVLLSATTVAEQKKEGMFMQLNFWGCKLENESYMK